MDKSFVGITAFFIAVASIAFQFSYSVPSSQQFILVSVESASDSIQYNTEHSGLSSKVDSVLLLKQLLPLLPVDDVPRITKSSEAEAKKVEKNEELPSIIDSFSSSYLIKFVDFVFKRSFCINENDSFYRLFDFYTPNRGPPALFML